MGMIIYGNKNKQPQITQDFIVSSNHLYIFAIISAIGFLSYNKDRKFKVLTIYLVFLSIILEIFHLIIPDRSFQWSDLFGNLTGVIIVIIFYILINKYGFFKK